MPTSDKLRRHSTTGKLLKQNAVLKKCDCCNSNSCPLIVLARPCYLTFDENCSRHNECDADKWVCVDATCDGTPIGHETPVVFYDSTCEKCFVTVPSSATPPSKVVPTPSPISGALTCVAGCQSETCNPPTTVPNACACACWNATNINPFTYDSVDWASTYCCLGKINPPFGSYTEPYSCWDFHYEQYNQIDASFTSLAHIGLACPFNISRGCDANASCVYYRSEEEGRPMATPHDPCAAVNVSDTGACCKKRLRYQREMVLRNPMVGDNCGLPYMLPLCCDCPNVATGIWAAVGGADYTVETCPPVNLGTTVFTETFVYATVGGCVDKLVHTTTYNYTCNVREVTEVYETFSRFDDVCSCQIYEKATSYQKYTYFSDGFEEECAQCKTYLGETMYFPTPHGFLDDYLLGV